MLTTERHVVGFLNSRATPLNAACLYYILMVYALGSYVVFTNGASEGNLFPGALLFLLTAPASFILFERLPEGFASTQSFLAVITYSVPVLHVLIGRLLWAGARRVLARLQPKRITPGN